MYLFYFPRISVYFDICTCRLTVFEADPPHKYRYPFLFVVQATAKRGLQFATQPFIYGSIQTSTLFCSRQCCTFIYNTYVVDALPSSYMRYRGGCMHPTPAMSIWVAHAMILSVIKANLKVNWILYCNRKKQKSIE